MFKFYTYIFFTHNQFHMILIVRTILEKTIHFMHNLYYRNNEKHFGETKICVSLICTLSIK